MTHIFRKQSQTASQEQLRFRGHTEEPNSEVSMLTKGFELATFHLQRQHQIQLSHTLSLGEMYNFDIKY